VNTTNLYPVLPETLVSGKRVFFAIIIEVELDAEPPGSVKPPACPEVNPKRRAIEEAVSFSIMVRAGETVFCFCFVFG